ncbi:MAG: M48 family metalloprotease [Acidobacteria bacterium]|nr:M48 family metalloprotease [Acidobacteriota bacterium]
MGHVRRCAMKDCVRATLAIVLCFAVGGPLAGQSKTKSKKNDPDQIGNRDVGKGINFYSLEREIALGKQMAQEIERQAKILESPVPAEFVNRVAQNIARNSDIRVPVTAKLIDSAEVNAFALPGGFLFVNTGLILKTETEAELAGVMAHEIAHAAARHGTRQASRGQVINFASLPLIFLGGWGGYAIRQGAGLAIPVAFLKFSRGFEREADLLGVQYVYKAGYDPTAFIDFFERLEAAEKKKPGTVGELFRSHPTIASRIEFTQKNIQELLGMQPQYLITTSEFQQVKQDLARATYGRKSAPQSSGPTLRRAPGSGRTQSADDPKTKTDQDERPTLKRRDP